MERIKKTAPTEAFGCIIDTGQESKTEILANKSNDGFSIPKGDVPMAFNNVGVFSIAPSQTIDWTCAWSWPGGDGDHGAQYFSAHPIDRQAVLIMSDQSKCRGEDNHISYGFKVTSHSPRTVFFSVQGGGFS